MGVKKNFAYNLLLTGANYIFPLLVFPYISRILDADLIGECSFIDSILNYVILFSSLGIGSYGLREAARISEIMDNYPEKKFIDAAADRVKSCYNVKHTASKYIQLYKESVIRK